MRFSVEPAPYQRHLFSLNAEQDWQKGTDLSFLQTMETILLIQTLYWDGGKENGNYWGYRDYMGFM